MESNHCSTCKKSTKFEIHGPFRDDTSYREFLISGLCQECQDEVFCDTYKYPLADCQKPCCKDPEDE